MTSFKKDSKVNTDAADETTTTVATSDTKPVSLAVPDSDNTSGFKIGTVSGPVRRTDYKIPALNIVHNTGALQENFDPGSLVLNKEVVLSDGEKPVKLTVLAFKKFFLEKLPYTDNGPLPRQFKDEAELAAAGLHTNWINDKPPPALEAGEALVAIESDTENPHFPFSFGDKYYALAIWRLNSASAFNRAGKLIITAGEWNLKDGLHNGSWNLTTRKEKLGGNWVFVPILKSGPRNSKDLAEFFASLL
jgi:hypothetical protein